MVRSSKSRFTLPSDSEEVSRLATGSHGDPFSILGRHPWKNGEVFRCFLPRTKSAWLGDESREMQRVPGTDLFEYLTGPGEVPPHYQVIRETESGDRFGFFDPYSFWPQLQDSALDAFHEGHNRFAQRTLGAHRYSVHEIEGTRFAVWAPNAGRVSVIGDFNQWDGRCHPMRKHDRQGIWEIFVPGLREGRYKFEIRNAQTGDLFIKTDPFARACEYRPDTAGLITGPALHLWRDEKWLHSREQGGWHERPLSVYEVHLGSWRRNEDGSFMGYRRLADELCDYVRRMGFTHVELMPIMEHPLDESWGYQTTGYFAPTSRFGSPDDFRAFVDHFHTNGIGVLLDWVPAHFPRDEHGLASFDGQALYEYHEPIKAGHPDWGTLVFNYERREVRSFLISNAIYWMKEFHLDGLRVDAVASMIYLNFSREEGEWLPNRDGGNTNLEAVDFLRELNEAIGQECPGCVMIAEESSAWPGVTRATSEGGLGFGLKWNMGWMHDTLDYFAKESIHRKFHHDKLTFGPMYAFDENFMLPLSHDEVVHLKKSLFGKMPGDEWQKFANLRLLYSFQWAYPGKKLLFMGGEFAQEEEWNSGQSLPWERSQQALPAGVMEMLSALNQLQGEFSALSAWDGDARGFEWLSGDDRDQSVISFLRKSENETVVVVLNFTPVVRENYRIPAPGPGTYRETFNSDASRFGGTGIDNPGDLIPDAVSSCGRDYSLCLKLPALAGVILHHQP